MPNSRKKPQLYYTMESAGNWLRLAVAAVDQAAAALCRNKWQLARIAVATQRSGGSPRGCGRVDRGHPMCDPVLH